MALGCKQAAPLDDLSKQTAVQMSLLNDRYLTVLALWSARLVSAFANVAVLAIGARGLNVTEFATFAFLVGLVMWLPLLDFGFGSVLQNRLIENQSKGRTVAEAVSLCLAGAVISAAIFAIIIAITMYFALAFSEPMALANWHVIIFVTGCLLVTGVSMMIHRILAAQDRLIFSSFLMALQSILALIAVAFNISRSDAPSNLYECVFAYFLPYTIAPLLALIVILRNERIQYHFSSSMLRSVAGQAFTFWSITFLSLVVVQIDQLIAYRNLSSSEFSRYAVATKVIGFAYFPFAALLAASWTRVSKAYAEANKPLLFTIVNGNIIVGGIYVFGVTILLALAHRQLSSFLPKDGQLLDAALILGVGLVAVNKVWTESYALIFQATGRVGFIAAYLPVQALLSVGCQLVLVDHIGVYGLMVGIVISYFATSHWLLPHLAKRLIAKI